jgi:two-component system response regulator RegA
MSVTRASPGGQDPFALHRKDGAGDPPEDTRSSGRQAQDQKLKMLIVDDDENHCWALQRAFEKRGYAVRAAHSACQAESLLAEWTARYAVVDLRMPGPCGMTLIRKLRQAQPDARIVVLTGYASIASAIEAIKLGAVYYLTKPVDMDTLESAFGRVCPDEHIEPSGNHLSVARLEWEHIQGVLSEHQGNISATARALGMHRRTLQRKLGKFPVRR